jgi:threonylcarbamoyladenosine tRNA methylthiotransferase MtaB
MKEVDAVVGNDVKLQKESFSRLVQGVFEPTRFNLDSGFRRNDDSSLASMQRAFVQAQNGCDNRCTFCIIPYGRGASRSMGIDAIVEQVRSRVDEGFNEIVLTGVDIASYGLDLGDRPTLGFMVRHVLKAVPQLQRLRLSSLDPAALDENFWKVVAEEYRLMPHLHLSLQAGDDMILKRMKRRHSRDDIFRLCDRARSLRADIVFGADIIAGFPTETDAMFARTCDLVEKCGLTWLHVFPYSSRKGTPAAKMPQVHGTLRKERADYLRKLGEKAARRHHESLIGKTIKVLVENNGIGCTPHFAKLKLLDAAPVSQIVDAHCVAMENDVVTARVGDKT